MSKGNVENRNPATVRPNPLLYPEYNDGFHWALINGELVHLPIPPPPAPRIVAKRRPRSAIVNEALIIDLFADVVPLDTDDEVGENKRRRVSDDTEDEMLLALFAAAELEG